MFIILACVLLLPAFTYAVLRSSRVQTYLAQRVAAYLSDEMQTQVSVGGVDISLFLNIVLEDVAMLDQDKQSLIYTHKMVFDIDKISLRRRFLSINKLYLEQAYLGLAKYPGQQDHNFQFVLDYFGKQRPDSLSRRLWEVKCQSFEFSNSAFNYTNHNFAKKPLGFDSNNFSISAFEMLINDVVFEKDTLAFELHNLAFKEARDFNLDSLSGFFRITPNESAIHDLNIHSLLSKISLDLVLEYKNYQAFSNFIDEVSMDLLINESQVDLADIGFFFPPVYGMKGRLNLLGNITGTVSNLKANNLLLLYGSSTLFKGGFHLNGLPEINETYINFFINDFHTNMEDVAGLQLPHWAANQFPVLPESFITLGKINFQGRLTGFVNDFLAFGEIRTDIGQARSDIRIRRDNGKGLAEYTGNLVTSNFDMGKFFNRPELMGTVSFNAQVKGRGFTLETIESDFTGQIDHISLANYNYQNLEIAGTFSNQMFQGSLLIEDENLDLSFNGLISFEQEVPVFDFSVLIDHANLTELNIYQRDSLMHSAISAEMIIQAKGATLDNMLGSLNVMDLTYYEISTIDAQKQILYTDNLSLVNENIDGIHKHLKFRSQFMDADLHGNIQFLNLGFSARQYASAFLPAIIEPGPTPNGNNIQQDFLFDFHFKNTRDLSLLLLPGIEISPDSHFNGAFDSQNKVFFFTAYSDDFSLKGSRWRNAHISGSQKQNGFKISIESQRILFSESNFIEQLKWTANVANDSLWFDGVWENYDTRIKNNGHIHGTAYFTDRYQTSLQFLPSYAFVNDSLWQVGAGNEILFDSLHVEVRNLRIFKNKESFLANGFIGSDPAAFLNLSFNNFNVDNFDFVFQGKNLEFAGIINGEISLASLRKAPSVHAEIDIKDFAFNKDHLGDLKLKSSWDHQRKAFQIDAQVIYYGNVGHNIPLRASGYFYPERKGENFDLDIRLENLKMSIFSRYLAGFAQNFRGLASGNMRLEGPAHAPELSGKGRLVRTGFGVQYLNTAYTFAHEVEVGKDFFRFNNLVLNDTLGNHAIINGNVYHNNFKNFRIDIRIQPNQMVVLNTTAAHNDLYYGRAFATGMAHIYGPVNDIVMDITARTNRGTQIFLPLENSTELIENNFITFISRDTTFVATPFVPQQLSGLTLNFDLEVTPEAEVQLIFDSQIGDIIRGRGTGNLKFEISSLGAFNMYGDYVIEEGDYLFTLQNLINKRFRIEQGGSIRWAGDPYDADIDLRAAYRLRTVLYDLMMDVDSSDTYRRRVPVETILELKGKLFNPSIAFGIYLPGGDEATRELVERLITTEQEMNRQVFSLLVLNRFMPSSANQYNAALGYGVGSTSSELLSNQLSNWLSQISSDFDLGFNYRPGDEISSQEWEVALSTQLFDDRVSIDGNIGMAGNNPSASNRTSNLIGDVVVEVKITPEGKFRIKAFNRSNTFDMMNSNSPYTQGIGIFYRKDFDSLKDLFRSKLKVLPQTLYREEEETGYLEE